MLKHSLFEKFIWALTKYWKWWEIKIMIVRVTGTALFVVMVLTECNPICIKWWIAPGRNWTSFTSKDHPKIQKYIHSSECECFSVTNPLLAWGTQKAMKFLSSISKHWIFIYESAQCQWIYFHQTLFSLIDYI